MDSSTRLSLAERGPEPLPLRELVRRRLPRWDPRLWQERELLQVQSRPRTSTELSYLGMRWATQHTQADGHVTRKPSARRALRYASEVSVSQRESAPGSDYPSHLRAGCAQGRATAPLTSVIGAAGVPRAAAQRRAGAPIDGAARPVRPLGRGGRSPQGAR